MGLRKIPGLGLHLLLLSCGLLPQGLLNQIAASHPRFLTWWVWGGAQDLAFLMSSQVMLVLQSGASLGKHSSKGKWGGVGGEEMAKVRARKLVSD